MRLGQLSRKIDVQPFRISAFLEEKNYMLDTGFNSKLTEEQQRLVCAHFDYVEEEIVVEEVREIIDESIIETVQPVEEVGSTPDAEEAVIEQIPEGNKSESAIIESQPENKVIRAPKIKLEGLKVVGKIDLPDPKVTQDLVDESANTESPVERKPILEKINQQNTTRRTSRYRTQKRTLTREEKQAKEECAKQTRNKQFKARQKQLKTAHYESRMRERKLISPRKGKRKSSATEEYIQKTTAPTPKTIWGKFMRWLNA